MRLTLRTLLAYLDDTLEPADAREIGQKVSQSEYAQQLARRIRDALRRRRLAAPDLTGPGARLDPNTVAEYLDNTLPPERVPSVEKVCLESDVHLAEVASCHQVLSLVLTEAAEVRPESRQRMYGLVAPRPAGALETAVSAPEGRQETKATLPRTAPEAGVSFRESLPDYLHAPWWRRLAVPAAVTACALLLVLVVWQLWPSERAAPPSPLAQAPAADRAPIGKQAPADVTQPPPAQVGTAPPPADQPPGDQEPKDQEAAVPEPSEPAPEPEPASTPPSTERTQPESAAAKEPEPEKAPEVVPEPTAAPPSKPEAAPSPPPAAKKGVADSAPPAAPVELGIYDAPAEILLLHDSRRDRWDRVPGRTKIYSSDRLVALPSYQPRLELPDVDLDLVGTAADGFYGTEATMLAPTKAAAFGLQLRYGRVAVASHKAGITMTLRLDPLRAKERPPSWQLTLLEPGTRVGVELRPLPPLGFDPQRPPSYRADVYVERGRLNVTGPEGDLVMVAPAASTLLHVGVAASADAPTAAAAATVPAWLTAPQRPALERASNALEERLRPGRPQEDEKSLILGLVEATQDRREEVRVLAVQCLATLGRTQDLVKILESTGTQGQEQVRREAIQALRFWLAQGPQRAEELWHLLVEHRGQQGGEERYRLLWGYTEADARQQDVVSHLIDLLEHEDLGVRELAIYNLARLSRGRMVADYRADDLPGKRTKAVQEWRQRHRDGALLPRGRF